jgi:hypothetical protein
LPFPSKKENRRASHTIASPKEKLCFPTEQIGKLRYRQNQKIKGIFLLGFIF